MIEPSDTCHLPPDSRQPAAGDAGAAHGRIPPPAASFDTGVTPPQQSRSEATLRALLLAGREALERGSFDDMTIVDIARAAGASVGAFYGRFKNKEAYFFALQHATIAEVESNLHALFATLERQQADARAVIEAFSAFWLGLYSNNRGLYRAASKHSSAMPGVWSPFKRLGYVASQLVVEHLGPKLKQCGMEGDEMRVRTAMQFVNGFLINSVINDPGPNHLDDPGVAKVLAHFLERLLTPPGAADRSSP